MNECDVIKAHIDSELASSYVQIENIGKASKLYESAQSGTYDPGVGWLVSGYQQTWNGSFSAVLKPYFASKCSLERF